MSHYAITDDRRCPTGHPPRGRDWSDSRMTAMGDSVIETWEPGASLQISNFLIIARLLIMDSIPVCQWFAQQRSPAAHLIFRSQHKDLGVIVCKNQPEL